MSSKRKLTLSLDAETIANLRKLSARRGVSLSSLVAECVERMLREERGYEEARQQALALLDAGFSLGGGPLPRREELYDRRRPSAR